jgi:DNA mismatch repair protein MutS
LTSRGVEKGERVPLAGVPLSSLETSVAKLVSAGVKVALCDQVEDPKQAKGLVRREIVEIVSAGTTSFPSLLEERSPQFLLALFPDSSSGRVGFARCDVTTGEFAAWEVRDSDVQDELDRIRPAEVLVAAEDLSKELSRALRRGVAVEKLSRESFPSFEVALARVKEGPGFAGSSEVVPQFASLAVTAAAALLDYLARMKKAERDELSPLELEERECFLVLDEVTLRNLEILRPLREGSGASLLSTVDATKTAMGGRLLRGWLARPLLSPERIRARQDAVEELTREAETRDKILGALDGLGDLERLAMRVAAGRAHGRDLRGLAGALARLEPLKEALHALESSIFAGLAREIFDFSGEIEAIETSLVDEPPLAVKEGGLIRPGHSERLDSLRRASREGKDWIASLQATERARTKISNLKIGYNRVFGYYLEVTKANRHLVPQNYEPRQTLVNAERFVTPELKEREAEILGADERSKALEYELFEELRSKIALACPRIRRTARSVAALDVLAGFASVALRRSWIRPAVNDSSRIAIRAGRHPVVEAALPAHEFVPNDAVLDTESRQILLITGPNMAGKSTYLRQVALIVILAQTGSFVPAEEAEIGCVDRIFTRVGASDDVASGHSTFMVEMVEVSRILAQASPRSLVLLDEVGRGTSTYDGLAIAWSVMEHLHETPERAARTLFATHYHELTELADNLERSRNLRVTVHEWKDDVVFLRKVVEGAADRSFGIQVARLAGLPVSVTSRAKKILAGLESGTFLRGRERAEEGASGPQLDLFSGSLASVLAELACLDPDGLTPREALAVLAEWKRRVGGTEKQAEGS